MNIKSLLPYIFSAFFILHCSNKENLSEEEQKYIQSIEQWHADRIASLKKDDGWLSLAGLYWLKEGANTFGSSESNDIVFPQKTDPGKLGTIFLGGNKLKVQIASDAEVICENHPVDEMELIPDAAGKPTILQFDNLSWYIIKRGDRYGVRLKDSASSNLKNFKGIETYPINIKWRIHAKLEPYNPPKTIPVPNVLGDVYDESCPGTLVFKIDNETYQLDPIAENDSDKYFIIFADETNGEETYGAGRFLYTDAVDSNGYTWIDFNEAYNPPCAFTEFATCPLPPMQNRLPIKINAGEKNYHGSVH